MTATAKEPELHSRISLLFIIVTSQRRVFAFQQRHPESSGILHRTLNLYEIKILFKIAFYSCSLLFCEKISLIFLSWMRKTFSVFVVDVDSSFIVAFFARQTLCGISGLLHSSYRYPYCWFFSKLI